MKLVDSKKFKQTLIKVLLDKGININIINPLVNSLIETSLKGVDSHGINLFPYYYQEISLNRVNVNPKLKFTQNSNAVATLDATNTLGHYVGEKSIKKAIQIAKKNGVGIVSVKNSTHFGAAGYFTNLAAKKGMIGLSFTNTEALINAFNSTERFFGTNPFCFSAPIEGEDPYCLDMATSVIPWNKVKNHQRQNQPLEQGWAYDNKGLPTVDPHKAFSLTNIGGYKGFGLSMVIEILCSGLTLGPLSKDILPLYDSKIDSERQISHFFMAINISDFVDSDLFNLYMKNMVTRIRQLPSSSSEKVMVAGDKEKSKLEQRTTKGIPIDDVKFNEFISISPLFKSTLL